MSLVQLGRGGTTGERERREREALTRAALCRALAVAFRPEVADRRRELEGLASCLPGQWSRPLLELAQGYTPELEGEYLRLFGAAGPCSLHESDHLPWRTFAGKGVLLGDVAAFYQAFRFDPQAEGKGSPDHLALLLSFLGFLAMKEAYAASQGDAEAQELCRAAGASFLEEHLAPWLGALAERLETVDAPPFWRGALALLATLLPEPAEEPPPSPTGAPDPVAMSGVPLDDLSGAPLSPEERPACVFGPKEEREMDLGQRPITGGLSSEHRVIERELDAAEHAARAKDWARLGQTLGFFAHEVALHRRKEEEVLFPALAEVPMLAAGPVRVMLLEHQEERQLLDALAGALPEGNPEVLQDLTERLTTLLRAHIQKEDQVLYRMAEEVLAGPPGQSVRETMDAIGYIVSDSRTASGRSCHPYEGEQAPCDPEVGV